MAPHHIQKQLTDLTDEIFYISLSKNLQSLLDQAKTWFIDQDTRTLVVRCQTPRQARMIWERYYSFSVDAKKTGLVENFSVYVGDKIHALYDWNVQMARILYEVRLKEVSSGFSRESMVLLSKAESWEIDHTSKNVIVYCSNSLVANELRDNSHILSADAQKSGLTEGFIIYVRGWPEPFYDWNHELGIMLKGIRLYDREQKRLRKEREQQQDKDKDV